MDQEQRLGLLRDFLKVLGSALVANGVISQPDWTTWTGLVVMLAPIGWSIYERTRARMTAKVDALPGVAGVVTTNNAEGHDLAQAVPSETVVSAGSNAAAALAKA
jgi:hypothetical protein